MKLGTQIFRQSAKALWISWVIDPTLLQGSNTVKTYAHLDLSRGRFRKLSCVFSGYPKVGAQASVPQTFFLCLGLLHGASNLQLIL